MISEPTTCNYCGRQIMWLRTAKGSFMPVDAEPSDRGNVLRQGDIAGVLGPNQAAAARAGGTRLRLHHAVSCPHASKWQGRTKAGPR